MKAQDWEEISTEYEGKIINGSYKIDRNIVTVKTERGTKKAASLRGESCIFGNSAFARIGALGKGLMGVLVVKCHVTGRDFSTGVHTDTDTFARMKNEVMQSRCPDCMSEHSWRPLDAKLVAKRDQNSSQNHH